ncbi:autoinducer binding domain-containing protein [Ponticoccus sp. SC2-23]|uniref:helix-turn-helix transcriptional regulator n=1 Tax=Alexandriicola marinus TaxID=2081710 RepID=UPI000FDA2085|nr:autoinducer binding domain-containing protein [Alexandriicola marinus]MBM1220161.1 autoinducer binding domain-containing protein [Ponticoccus sp. SC6-9]MBM1224847.1 autoinducer binding domain-containing protein [Ponticoccus sp. SC6-15]MBM1228361.1 autoinducer binding domain-containing protein [Ponticoccus sp. SC6-38]MBM1234002.1 autoinducer binding domain-containing protein [Ponticoccus sp. SC6-45]MBM1238862.1 autoinducer binding domain-containing protein [Ponticoccus sp. SC6-49]MBM1242644
MALDLEGYLIDVERARGLEDIQTLILHLRDQYGVDHIVYHWVSSDGEQYGCGTYSPEWAQRYVDKDYLRVDPVVIGCFQRFHPVDWRKLDWSSKAARAFQAEARDYGVGRQGFSIPVRGPNGQFALLTVSHDCDDEAWDAFTLAHQRELILIAHYFNLKALELEHARAPEPIKSLSPREVDTLTFLAMGYSRGQVADMLSISEHTLRAYIESARFKLNAANTTHAITRAITEGLIVVGGTSRAADGGWPGRRTPS